MSEMRREFTLFKCKRGQKWNEGDHRNTKCEQCDDAVLAVELRPNDIVLSAEEAEKLMEILERIELNYDCNGLAEEALAILDAKRGV